MFDVNNNIVKIMICFLFVFVFVGCASATQPIQQHAFFSGQAFLDVNNNGQIDTEDTSIANATFIVTLQNGTEFGGQTDNTGNAFVTVPATVEYPVTVRVEAPQDSDFKVIGPSSSTITLEESSGIIAFLFSK